MRPHISSNPIERIVRVAPSILIGLVICAVLLEVGLRIAAPFSRIVRFATWSPKDAATVQSIRSPEDIVRHVPTTYPGGSAFMGMHLSRHGFWTPPYARDKQPGALRLLILGDSFAFSSGGVPFELTWHTLVAEKLAEAWAKQVEPVNLGIPSAGPRLAARIYDVEGASLDPDIVMLTLFLGNDFTDESMTRSIAGRWSMLARLLANADKLPDFLSLASYNWRSGTQQPSPDWTPGRYVYDPTIPTFPDDVFLHIERERAQLFAEENEAWARQRISDVTDVVAGLHSRVSTAGGVFLVVVIPDELEVNADLRAAVIDSIEAFSGTRPNLGIDRTHQLIASELRARGIAFLDLLPTMRNAALERSPYRPQDTHWDDRGNRIAAEAIAEWTLRNSQKLGIAPVLAAAPLPAAN